MKKIILLTSIFVLSFLVCWHFDVFHKPVEPIPELLGENIDFAIKEYFRTGYDNSLTFSINGNLNELQGSILKFKNNLKDTMIWQYTWVFNNYKVTVWTAKTNKLNGEIIDAIRYKNSVKF